MSTLSGCKRILTAAATEELLTQADRLQDPQAATIVWERFLSAADRRCLGNHLERAYLNASGGRTIGMWMRAKKVDRNRAIADLAFRLGFILQPTYAWLLQELEGSILDPELQNAKMQSQTSKIPAWDVRAGKLWYRGRLIKKIESVRKAKNVVPVLNAFQEEGWPDRIDDPTPKGNIAKLHQTIESLNVRLKSIRFHGDGTGTGFRWTTISVRPR